jgi:hypothetical protein
MDARAMRRVAYCWESAARKGREDDTGNGTEAVFIMWKAERNISLFKGRMGTERAETLL